MLKLPSCRKNGFLFCDSTCHTAQVVIYITVLSLILKLSNVDAYSKVDGFKNNSQVYLTKLKTKALVNTVASL